MRKSEIKKMLMRMDDIPLPAKEKMLPPEALVERSNPVRRKRKAFPKFAAAGFATVALVLAGALLVESIADKGGKSVLPDNDSVLVNDGVSADVSSAPSSSEDDVAFAPAGTDDADFKPAGAITADSAITSGSSDSGKTEDMPIISSGKYNGYLCTAGPTKSDTDENGYKRLPGRAYLYSMDSPYQRLDMDEFLTRDDTLYAVQISYDTQYSENYIQGKKEITAQIMREYQQALLAFVQRVLDDVRYKYGDNAITDIVDSWCEDYFKNYTEFKDYFNDRFKGYFENSDDINSVKESICSELKNTISNLTSDNISFDTISDNISLKAFCSCFIDDASVYVSGLSKFADSVDEFNEWFYEWKEAFADERQAINDEYLAKDELEQNSFRNTFNTKAEARMDRYLDSLDIKYYQKTVCHTDDAGEVLLTEVYSVAFLTREQIKSLKGGTDYALIITLVCDEMAKMENDTIYFNDARDLLTVVYCPSEGIIVNPFGYDFEKLSF